MSWIKKILSITGYILINSVLAFLLTELTLRYVFTPEVLALRLKTNQFAAEQSRKSSAIFEHHSLHYRPASKNHMLHAEYSIETVHDPLGFRNPCYASSDINSANLILGDSFVYGTGLSDDYTFGCLLLNYGISSYTIGVPGADIPKLTSILNLNIGPVKDVFQNLTKLHLVIFLGNDFESLVNYHEHSVSSKEKREAGDSPNFVNQVAGRLNYIVTTQPFFSESYALVSLKLVLMDMFISRDKGLYYVNYGGSSFYKRSAEKPIKELEMSLHLVRKELSYHDIELSTIILIEDPAALSSERLERDALLGNFSPNDIDVRFKVDSLMTACVKVEIRCIETLSHLNEQDYYSHDNHLREKGAAKLIKIIAKSIADG